MSRRFLRIGHKGADAIEPGNTLASFHAAVEAGVDVIELDVLRPRSDFPDPRAWRRAKAGPAPATDPLLVAHDWGAVGPHTLTLSDTLAAFTKPPLDSVRINLDLKIAGREDEVVSALNQHGVFDRASISTMETRSIHALRELAPELPRGWTIPRARRDYTRNPLLRPAVLAGSAALRRRLPALIRRHAPRLGAQSIWLYHPLATPRIAAAAHDAGCKLICWTVDDRARIDTLLGLGADGICTNDPRLFAAPEPLD